MAAQEDLDQIAKLWDRLELAVWGKIGNTLEVSQSRRIHQFLVGMAQERDTLRAKYEQVVLFCKEEAARDIEKIQTLRAENERLKDFVGQVKARLDASEPRPRKGGQEVGPMAEDWHMTPTTRHNIRRLLESVQDKNMSHGNNPAGRRS